MDYRTLSESELFERNSPGSSKGNGESPPLTLILGSGLSYGVIPTTAQIVQKDLPWWMSCQQRTDGHTPQEYLATLKAPDDDAAKANARAFWERVLACHRRQPEHEKRPIKLDAEGVPDKESVGEAYRFALSPRCTPGLCEPDYVRRYFGDMIRRAGLRTNPAHQLLASIIAAKPRLFGTIFTTNFDHLLQRSLQLVNAPYFVSDRPDTLQYPDDDDVFDDVHLIHAHGSIFRYLLVNSPEEIERYAEVNQPKLQEYFRKRAVLIIGFAGWDDAITRALAGVATFARSLYWLDRGSSLETSHLTQAARGILKKHVNAFYVPIKSADDVMAKWHQHLTKNGLTTETKQSCLDSRRRIFISYSHKDEKYISELLTHLQPMEKSLLLEKWSDKDINPGAEWFSKIQDAIESADVAVLLVSPDFLASQFIRKYELPQVLEQRDSRDLCVFWIPVRASSFNTTPLKDIQAVIDPNKPLAEKGRLRDKAWVHICAMIQNELGLTQE
jgi:hypothetical protein